MKVTAQDWDQVWKSKSILMKILDNMRQIFTESLYKKVFQPYINKNTKILELGCGSSTTSLYIAPKIKQFTGLDTSNEALSLSKLNAKKLNVKNAKFVKGDCFHIPFKDNSFDIVWSQGLLEHFDNPQGIMNEAIRTTKKNGYIITIVPATFSFHKLWYIITRPKLLRKLWPWTKQKFFTQKRLNALIDNRVDLKKIFYYYRYGVIVQITEKKF